MLISKEAREKIIALWQEGKTGSEIAAEINSTRNSVIGFINRERKRGIDLRGAAMSPRKPRVKPPKKIVSIFEKRLPAAERGSLLIHELTPQSCRFIVSGSGAESMFCGSGIQAGSYCEKHRKICYKITKALSM